jgi:hypothetical protein
MAGFFYLSFAKDLAIRDFRREDLFFFMTFFLTALSRADMAAFMAVMASLFLPARISFLTSLTADLNLSLVPIFLALRRIDCLMALAALLVFGMIRCICPP